MWDFVASGMLDWVKDVRLNVGWWRDWIWKGWESRVWKKKGFVCCIIKGTWININALEFVIEKKNHDLMFVGML